MITDKQAESAADWIRDNAGKIASAKAERTYNEEYRKSLKAIIFNESEGTVAERENKAYADKRYLEHLKTLKQSVFADEELRAMKVAAEIKIEVWRSLQANLRGKI